MAQYIPSEVNWEQQGVGVRVSQQTDPETGYYLHPDRGSDPTHRPNRWVIDLTVTTDRPVEFTLRLRLPWWLNGQASLTVNGEEAPVPSGPSSFASIERTWNNDQLRLVLPTGLTVAPLPDATDMVAFLDGPVVLAGLTEEERALYGDKDNPASMLAPDNERAWDIWRGGYRTVNQDSGLRFVPLLSITDEPYTVYFPIRQRTQ